MIFAMRGVSAERGRAHADTAGKDMPAFCGGFETTAVGELGHGPSLFFGCLAVLRAPYVKLTTGTVLGTASPVRAGGPPGAFGRGKRLTQSSGRRGWRGADTIREENLAAHRRSHLRSSSRGMSITNAPGS